MAITRSMTRKQNRDDASSKKRIKRCDNGDTPPWSDLDHNLLFLVMMQLGFIDFLAFGGVCKSWRSLALANKKIFMESKPPMLMSISGRSYKKEFYFEDGRKFKTIVPHAAGRTCVGVTCGYLILFGRKTRDFWLVNPITRQELRFPCFPSNASTDLARIRAILVFSPLVFGWVFVMLHKLTRKIWFSIAGTRAWNRVTSTFLLLDLHAFKGKIYTINMGYRVCEMRLNPNPKLTLLQTTNFPKPGFVSLEFISLGENLYVIDCRPEYLYEIYELDFDQMKWVSSAKTLGGCEVFINGLKYYAAIKPELLVDHRSQYERYGDFLSTIDKSPKGGFFSSHIWYFPNDCMNVNSMNE